MQAILDQTEALPIWVMIFERIGPGSAILVFTGAVLWKLLPAMLKLLGAWKRQSDTITTAIPVAQKSLGRLADTMERGFEKLNEKLYSNESHRKTGS